MYRSIKIVISIILFLFIIGFPKLLVVAEDENVGYSVRAIIPVNQIDKNHSYFDLMMQPGQKQTIEVEVFNRTNKAMEINCHITNAVTNRNGLIDYTNQQPTLDKSLKHPMTDIATLEKNKIIVPAKQTTIVPVQLHVPRNPFDGIILGGIYFEKSPDKAEVNQNHVQIDNKYAYVIGLKIQETKKKIKPNLQLKSVYPNLVNYRTAVVADIQNSEPAIVDHLKIDAKILNSRGKIIHERKVEDFRMAPNSSMEFVMDWDNNQISPGEYTMRIHASNQEQEWNWDKTFEIAKDEAKKLNEESVEQDRDYTFFIVIGLILVIFILMILLFKSKKENKQLKKQ